MRRSTSVAAAAIAVTLTGCAGVEDAPLAASASTGYLAHDDGYVDPFCHAVQVGPARVLTATECARRDAPSWLSFAVELDPGAFVGVEAESPGAVRGELLTHLDLEAPPTVGQPAPIRAEPVRVGDVIVATSFTATLREVGPPTPSRWSAEVIAIENDGFVAELLDGAPGCHGELGAAAFTGEELAGILVGTVAGGPEHPDSPVCVTRYRFAVPPPPQG